MNFIFSRKEKPVGGILLSEEDFIVEEVIDNKFLRKFKRIRGKIIPMDGKYSLYIMGKKDMNTKDAIKKIEKILGKKDIGYAGLKDKNAITKQYITIKGEFGKNIVLDKIRLAFVQKIDKHISVGNLVGNKFTITLHEIKTEPDKIIKEVLDNGIPNYFGPQRFGVNENNHIIGRHLIKKDFDRAMELIQKDKKYKKMAEIPKNALKFYIHAYQSWILNKTLEEYVMNNGKPYFFDIDIVGFDTKLKNDIFGKIIMEIMKKEGILTKDFYIREIKIKSIGSKRKAFIKIDKIDYKTDDNNLILNFFLPKGSYATILISYISL